MEAHRVVTDIETGTRRSPQDTVERTPDHYFSKNNNNNGKKPGMKKRKACGVDEKGREINLDALKGSYANDVTVSTSDNEIVIELKCPSKAGRLLEIMDPHQAW